MTYRVYLTDAAKVLTRNTANLVGGEVMSRRYGEIIHPGPVDDRSADEIAADVIKNAGLEVRR